MAQIQAPQSSISALGPSAGDENESMDIAVIGLSGRFPGDADNPAKLWDLVKHGRSAAGPVPESRFNSAGFYHPHGDRAGTSNTQGGFFLSQDVGVFDAGFFSITPAEAAGMDPAQRILLELAYEGLENAGLTIRCVDGADISCFIGACQRDYWDIQTRDIDSSARYTATGTGPALVANRVSWFFNLRGQSVTVDTACSSSLTALNLACKSLQSGETKMALVGGLSLILLPHFTVFMSTLSFLSPDSQCHSFDKSANGYARGEGGGFVVLKPVRDAIRDGDVIRAVIRGTGVNQDGKTPGITLPSAKRQEELIRSVYAKAGLDPAGTGYFEAHGTGTNAGDPTECSAIGAVFGSVRDEPIRVGSVKSNIGHLEGASGIASLIKSIYSLESGLIAPTHGLVTINPKIRAEEWNIEIPKTHVPWPPGLRRISINSFGYGGANAHCIMDDAYHYLTARKLVGSHTTSTNLLKEDLSILQTLQSQNGTMVHQGPHPVSNHSDGEGRRNRLFILSTTEKSGIAAAALRLRQFLQSTDTKDRTEEARLLDGVSYTLLNKRSKLLWSGYMVASSIQDLVEKLERPMNPPRKFSRASDLGFIFTGQGAQWFAMGRELLQYSIFRRSLIESGDCFIKLGSGWDLMEELRRDEKHSRVNDPAFSQPICTALQIALVDLLESWSVRPRLVIGHSSGEIAAAYCKQAISKRDALGIAYWRGKLSSDIKTQGAMAAVGVGPETAAEYIERVDRGKVVIACVNSPSSVTLSGDVAAVDEAVALISGDNFFARKLKVRTAYHSHHMKPIASKYLSLIADTATNVGNDMVTMVSSVTGEVVLPRDLSASYWVKNLLNPVQFSAAVAKGWKLQQSRTTGSKSNRFKIAAFVEIGPHAALKGPLSQILEPLANAATTPLYTSMLSRGYDATETALEAMGDLLTVGIAINTRAVTRSKAVGQNSTATLPSLPSYVWNHSTRYWNESAAAAGYRMREQSRQDFLGTRDELSTDDEPRWRNYLRTFEQPWIRHHQFQDTNIYPMAGMIVMVVEALRQIHDTSEIEGFVFRDLKVENALIVTTDESVETSLQFRPWRNGSRASSNAWTDFTISSRNEKGKWTSNCQGLVRIESRQPQVGSGFYHEKASRSETARQLYESAVASNLPSKEVDQFYQDISASGLNLGPSFQCVVDLKARDRLSVFQVKVTDTAHWAPGKRESPHLIHPAVLDTFVHLLISNTDTGTGTFTARVPVFAESVYISNDFDSHPGSLYYGRCNSFAPSPDRLITDIIASDKDWKKPLIAIHGCQTVPLAGSSSQRNGVAKQIEETMDLKQWFMGQGQASKASSDLTSFVPRRGPDFAMHSAAEIEGILQRQVAKFGTPTEPQRIQSRIDEPCPEGHRFLSSGLVDSVAYFIGAAANKQPGLRVLDLSKSGTIRDLLIHSLGQSAHFPGVYLSYMVVAEEDCLAAEPDSLPSSFQFASKSLNELSASTSDGSATEVFDLIITDDPLSLTGETSLTGFGAIRDRVEQSGAVLVVGEAKHIEDTILNLPGFDVHVRGAVDTISPPLSFAISLAPSQPSRLPDKVILSSLHAVPERSSATLNALKPALREKGCQVRQMPFANLANEDLSGTFLVICVEDELSLLPSQFTDEFLGIVQQAVRECSGILWVTLHQPSGATLDGMVRTIRAEDADACIGVLQVSGADGEPDYNERAVCVSHIIQKIYSSQDDPTADKDFHLIDGVVHIERIYPDSAMTALLQRSSPRMPSLTVPYPSSEDSRQMNLSIAAPGSLDTLTFLERRHDARDQPLSDNHIKIRVRATALNFRDVMVAMGQLNDNTLGIECSGTVLRVGKAVRDIQPGDDVYGMHSGCIATTITADYRTFRKKPAHLSHGEAASLTCVYTTVVHSLIDIARLQPGETVLIHSAAGGVGQAAIRVAQHVGASIIATVSTPEKRAFLVSKYGLDSSHILHSRGLSFKDGVMRLTSGRGVDVVLNSLAGEALRYTWLCVAPFGRFVELGKRDILDNTGLEMMHFANNITFSGVDILHQVAHFPDRFQAVFAKVGQMLENGVVVPLPTTSYDISNLGNAFRDMQSGRHHGKLVIDHRPGAMVTITPPDIYAERLSAEVSYLLIGGLGGIGRSIASMMVEMGAKTLIFLSRKGPSNENQKDFLRRLRASGVDARALTCDVGEASHLEAALASIQPGVPPIRGMINCAMQLQDGIFQKLGADQWNSVLRSKVNTTKNLHQYLPSDLDFFICLSSVAGIIGSRGQSNYNSGNTFQDAFVHYRRSIGLPGSSINLSLVTDVGVATEKNEAFQLLSAGGLVGMNEQHVLIAVRAAIAQQTPSQSIIGLSHQSYFKRADIPEPYWLSEARFLPLKSGSEPGQDSQGGGDQDFERELSKVSSLTTAVEIVLTGIMQRLAKLTNRALEDLDSSQPPSTYGVDSLVAVELRNWISNQLKSNVSIFEIVGKRSVAELAATIASQSTYLPQGV
ncbi:unnamed protein product [Clonostachys solani]|uniref:Carrier domain-containing protein n=1 Tax=Clonostachys solani TaxID=160281 RepID=A0A9P0EHU3_9HYPO|nr:unnamed protein product [Clonostachys solani]